MVMILMFAAASTVHWLLYTPNYYNDTLYHYCSIGMDILVTVIPHDHMLWSAIKLVMHMPDVVLVYTGTAFSHTSYQISKQEDQIHCWIP